MFLAVNNVVAGALGFAGGALVIYAILRWKEQTLRKAREAEAQSILDNARRDAESAAREARLKASEEALKLRQETEQSFTTRLKQITESEARLGEREALVARQLENVAKQEAAVRAQGDDVATQAAAVAAQQEELAGLISRRLDSLAGLAKLSETEARAQLLQEVEQQAEAEASALSRRIVDEAKNRAEEKARWIIATAIQRYAGSHTFESTSATLNLPDNEIKGRIIGREGRNIRAFEGATGVTVLVDDTPNAVVLSGFDPVRREIAREAMQRLILDGRIHPSRIEEVVNKVRSEMDESVVRSGEDALVRAGVGPMHHDLVKLLGRLKFRMSYSQNVLEHSIEVAHLVALMAGELGADIETAKRAGLLHDVGKAVSHEIEGPHALVGADIAKRCGEPAAVVNGIASHHGEVPQEGVWGVLVAAADAISASRPGARSETLTTYIKRVEDLERIAMSFDGVEKVYAVQAGREVRVMVQPDEINDAAALKLAADIVKRIESELQYPGQIRVTVIRETRCSEVAT